MREFAEQADLDVWYARLDVDISSTRDLRAELSAAAARRTSSRPREGADQGQHPRAREADRHVDGELRIVGDPPLIVPLEELFARRRWRAIADDGARS